MQQRPDLRLTTILTAKIDPVQSRVTRTAKSSDPDARQSVPILPTSHTSVVP